MLLQGISRLTLDKQSMQTMIKGIRLNSEIAYGRINQFLVRNAERGAILLALRTGAVRLQRKPFRVGRPA